MRLFSQDSYRLLRISVFCGLIVFFAIPLSFHQIYANDIWKALYSGRYLTLFHHFPHHSTFTFSPVKELVTRDTFNWLGNLVLLGLYGAGGVGFLQGFKFYVVLFSVGLSLSLVESRWTPLVLLFTFCYMVGIKQKLLMRTAVFVVPGMVVLFWLLMKYDLSGSSSYLWGLPVLFLFWGNLHGSYLAGFGFLLLAWLGRAMDFWRSRDSEANHGLFKFGFIVLVVVLTLVFVKPFPDYKLPNKFLSMTERAAGLVVNPGKNVNSNESSSGQAGQKHPPKVEEVRGEGSSRTSESWYVTVKNVLNSLFFPGQSWRSNEFAFPLTRYSYLFVSMTLVLFPLGLGVFLVGRSHFRYFHFIPVFGALVLSITSLRTVGYFPLVIFPVVLAKAQQGHFSSVKMGKGVRYAGAIGVAMLCINLGYYLFQGKVYRFFGVRKLELRQDFSNRFSDKVPHYVLTRYPDERVFTQYNVAGHLVWKWWPYKKVFFDSKGSAYKEEFFREYGRKSQEKLMRKYNLDYAVNPYSIPLLFAYYIPDSEWRMVAFDEGKVFIGRANREPSREILDLFLLNSEEFRALRPRIKESIRGFLSFLKFRRNLTKLEITEDMAVEPKNPTEQPIESPGPSSGSSTR